ncbi:hypothetical protein [Paraurantiacibacter namhicola]|uniref:Lipoprotein n=1 Tax=Paraurantiacibacter namhicola TaxID=645517 RepID=A0A1C7D8B4_9SPHN|nr:hypothetical protein [Paraurantiacibacter namhicola]ANU07561.1 hypothetical protein A6F65_01254 [Paraurantiacibacter namhicola]
MTVPSIRRLVALAAGAGALALPGAAQADWNWTQWGMTPEAVVDASGGAISAVEDHADYRLFGLHHLAAGTQEIGGITYEAGFLFEPGDRSLKLVNLVPDRGDCAEMEVAAKRAGDPDRQQRDNVSLERGTPPVLMRTLEWDRDDGGKDRMILLSAEGAGTLFCKTMILAPGVG